MKRIGLKLFWPMRRLTSLKKIYEVTVSKLKITLKKKLLIMDGRAQDSVFPSFFPPHPPSIF